MTIGTEESSEAGAPASLIDALLVYAEPLASGAHALVIGNAESSIADRLLDLGARGVHVFDPDADRAASAARSVPRGVTVRALEGELDVRDGAFDLAVVADLAGLTDPRSTVARLRRAVARSGAVVAMGRARLDGEDDVLVPFESDLGPAALGYDELYDLFAAEFEQVSLVGVVPFEGVVFAELGTEDESPAVSVDTRLGSPDPPRVFLVVASDTAHGRPELDPYAIVQVPPQPSPGISPETTVALESAFAAAQLKAELAQSQLEEMRERLVVADARAVETAARLDRAAAERDAALTRAMELEAVLAASQQSIASVERRLLAAEQGMLERDDRIAALSAELDVHHSAEAAAPRVDVDELVARAERAESGLAQSLADLAQLMESHSADTAGYEEQLTGRARAIASLEKELIRREQLVKELVSSLEESRERESSGLVFEAAAPVPPPSRPDPALTEEVARLRKKLDELAAEVARREGELIARGWRITELENECARLAARPTAGAVEEANPEGRNASLRGAGSDALARAQDELDALRQALTQEHAARLAAESGEELARARSELARQAALLEQMRSRAESS